MYWFSNKSSSQDEQLWRFVIIFAICPLKIFQIQLFLLKLHKKSKAGENCFFCPHNQKRTHAHNAIYTVGWQTKWHGGLMSLRQDDKTGASPDVIVMCHTDTLHCHIILSHCDSILVTVSQHFVKVSLFWTLLIKGFPLLRHANISKANRGWKCFISFIKTMQIYKL